MALDGIGMSLLAGVLCGVISGLGIGGGSLLMIWLTAVLCMDQRTAQGINLLYFLPCAAAGLFFHTKNRLVRWDLVVPAVICGCVTAAAAAWVAQSLELGLLRKGFGAFLVVVGVLELKKAKKPRNRAGRSRGD